MKNLYITLFLVAMAMAAQAQITGGPIPGAGQTPGQSFPNPIGSPTGPIHNVPYDVGGPTNPGNDPNGGYDRTIFWIHGLNGSPDGWSRASEATQYNVAGGFPARKVECVIDNMTYSQNGSLWLAGRGLKQNIQQQIAGSGQTETKYNFNIAHSQGGIVSRAMFDNLYCKGESGGQLFGTNGLITYGTPHQGAQLLNNQDQFLDFASDICNKLGSAYAYWFLTRKITIKLPLNIKVHTSLSNFTDPGELAGEFCQLFDSTLFKNLSEGITPPITEHYQVGSQQLNEINNSCESIIIDTMHKMAFYGVEDTVGIMFRTLYYFDTDPNQSGYFTANPDDFWIEDFQEIVNKFEERKATMELEREFKKRKFKWKKCKIWPQSTYGSCITLKREIRTLERGIQAIKLAIRTIQQMSESYRTIIGAIEYAALPAECVCKNNYGEELYRGPFNGELDCELKSNSRERVFCEKDVRFRRNVKDSDGVVLAESASNMPGSTHMPIMLDESSHMQMRNDKELRRTLSSLYDGGFDAWFACELK